MTIPADKEYTPRNPIRNAMTIDVEDYFQVSAFAAHIPRDSWPSQSCRVEANIDRILTLLDENGVKATFFHPRLDCGALPDHGAPDCGQRP